MGEFFPGGGVLQVKLIGLATVALYWRRVEQRPKQRH